MTKKFSVLNPKFSLLTIKYSVSTMTYSVLTIKHSVILTQKFSVLTTKFSVIIRNSLVILSFDHYWLRIIPSSFSALTSVSKQIKSTFWVAYKKLFLCMIDEGMGANFLESPRDRKKKENYTTLEDSWKRKLSKTKTKTFLHNYCNKKRLNT